MREEERFDSVRGRPFGPEGRSLQVPGNRVERGPQTLARPPEGQGLLGHDTLHDTVLVPVVPVVTLAPVLVPVSCLGPLRSRGPAPTPSEVLHQGQLFLKTSSSDEKALKPRFDQPPFKGPPPRGEGRSPPTDNTGAFGSAHAPRSPPSRREDVLPLLVETKVCGRNQIPTNKGPCGTTLPESPTQPLALPPYDTHSSAQTVTAPWPQSVCLVRKREDGLSESQDDQPNPPPPRD